ncbi:cation transporter [Haloechinothrix salitolerans]|uniref:Sodium:calcium antiporter n=1 Tax=Haloechinothrix salitolerans TaxID=926830 RepID=A0ABW2C2C0_9PSEU
MSWDVVPATSTVGIAGGIFIAAAVVTIVFSMRLVRLGDALADRTGWGEALFGAVLFGAATSLSGIVMTGVSAGLDEPELAYSNAVGGIAVQTLAIVLADIAYRRVNLEHAAASARNLLFGCLLIVLLATALFASFSPAVTAFGVHPMSVVLIGFYWGGLALITKQGRPLWRAVTTIDTRADVPEAHGSFGSRGMAGLWTEFAAVALGVIVAGWAVARSAEVTINATGLRAGFVGAVLMGLVNALPEMVTAIAAVRQGALTLAIAAVIGGNCLDALNLVVGDIAYRGGSLYHAAGPDQLLVTTAGLVMTGVVLGGLLLRQRGGWLRVGFDGIVLALVYATTVAGLVI